MFLHSVFRVDLGGVPVWCPTPPSTEEGSSHLPVHARLVESGRVELSDTCVVQGICKWYVLRPLIDFQRRAEVLPNMNTCTSLYL